MTTLLKGAPYPSLAATADTLQPTEHDTPVSWNAWTLKNEMAWFCRVLETRLQLYFKNDCEFLDIDDIPAPDLIANPSEYGQLVQDCQMNTHERMVLILTLIPAETAAFIIAGNDLSKRLDVFQLFNSDHFFTRLGILNVQPGQFHEAYLTAPLVISREYLNRLTIGQIEKPDFSMHFPAKLLETPLHWEDLVLPAKTRDDVAHIQTWLQHHHYISCKMGFDKSIKPGYRALFYGPPGTGKTLTASLLGKVANMDVYRIELSSVVSKFIGETEKNLEAIFRQAENRNWILFFDEADALFGKRSETQSSNDRYANQEVAYLLQRIEDFPGVVILASNLKSNIDDAFLRRFQSMVYFPMPDIQDRLKLWQKALGDSDNVADDVDLGELARQYDMAGGAIINVIRYAAIATVKDGREKVEQRDLVAGIIKEQRKQGKLT
ncbi:MAG: ATP-binding protein [Reinekea sp.]